MMSQTIIDTTEEEDQGVQPPILYDLTSYGADYPVDGLVSRITKEEPTILIPDFQRGYVWNKRQASKFIESLLLGLPVPGIFLAKEEENRLLVVDGQQRLRTLQYFYGERFEDTDAVFRLISVDSRFEGKKYSELDSADRNRLDDSIIHATIVRQNSPENDDSSIYQIFERLNTNGVALNPQEIRSCLFHGPFNDLLNQLNDTKEWRTLFGPKNKRMKDQEMILRFFALYYSRDRYSRPMKQYLNDFMSKNRRLQVWSEDTLSKLFTATMAGILKNIGKDAFKPERAFNAAVFDAIAVGYALAHKDQEGLMSMNFKDAYRELLANPDFVTAYQKSTADEGPLARRIELARSAFGGSV